MEKSRLERLERAASGAGFDRPELVGALVHFLRKGDGFIIPSGIGLADVQAALGRIHAERYAAKYPGVEKLRAALADCGQDDDVFGKLLTMPVDGRLLIIREIHGEEEIPKTPAQELLDKLNIVSFLDIHILPADGARRTESDGIGR